MNQTDLKHKLSAPFDFNEWKTFLPRCSQRLTIWQKKRPLIIIL